MLAADACTECGLTVHKTSAETRRRLRALVPSDAAVNGPVDTTAAVSETTFRRCLELVAADEGVDAVLALVLPTAATGQLVTAIRAADIQEPFAAVVLDQAEAVRLLPPRPPTRRPGRQTGRQPTFIPSYAYPEAAAHALARAASYGAWRARPAGHVREFGDVATDDARALVRKYLAATMAAGCRQRGWRRCLDYGIPLASLTPVTSADERSAPRDLGGPVVLKADVPGLLHKTDAGAVQLDLRTEAT